MNEAGPIVANSTLALWDWRRRMAELFHAVRANPDAQAGWRHWTRTRAEMFANHPQSPLDDKSALPVYFAYDPRWRFAVDLVPVRETKPLFLPAGVDGDVALTPFARTFGLAGALGAELTLYWVGGYGGGAFLPFLDATSGTECYGGGRYVLDTIKSADLGTTAEGKTVLDFNFAYNPSCHYSPRWTCPLAPAANRLTAAVRAGERLTAP